MLLRRMSRHKMWVRMASGGNSLSYYLAPVPNSRSLDLCSEAIKKQVKVSMYRGSRQPSG